MTSFETCLFDKVSLYAQSKALPMCICRQTTAVPCVLYSLPVFRLWLPNVKQCQQVPAFCCLFLFVEPCLVHFCCLWNPFHSCCPMRVGCLLPWWIVRTKLKGRKTGRFLLVHLPCGCYRYNRPCEAGNTLHLVLLPSHFSGFFIVVVIINISFFFFFISWRLITLQYCSGFCHTLTWISHGFTCIPHPDPPSHLHLYPIPLLLCFYIHFYQENLCDSSLVGF